MKPGREELNGVHASTHIKHNRNGFSQACSVIIIIIINEYLEAGLKASISVSFTNCIAIMLIKKK